ncbi:MAG: alanine racemase [Erythrobacter sp.]
MSLEPPPPTLRLKIATEALAQNWRSLDRLSGSARAGAAVKADCYGLGVETCVPVLRDAGCDQFFVAHWSEVATVARHVPAEQIAVLHGPLKSAEAEYARSSAAIPVINSLFQAELWRKSGGGRCHLMVDTGINRLGVSNNELGHADIQALDVDILMSHLASADEESSFNGKQLAAFREASGKIAHQSLSLANSAGIACGYDFAFDLTRPGLSLYGGVPRSELAAEITQVAFPEAAVLQIRELKAGESVGYNATFTATGPMRIGTVSLGYADGFLRSWADRGTLHHRENTLPLLGRISMDMVAVDLSKAPDISAGDWLSVPYHLPDAAQQSPLTQYELLTVLGQRLRR